MDLEIQNIRKLEHLSIRNLAQDFTNMRQMWQSVTIFINVLGMVHTTKHFVYSPREIIFSLSQTTAISK